MGRQVPGRDQEGLIQHKCRDYIEEGDQASGALKKDVPSKDVV